MRLRLFTVIAILITSSAFAADAHYAIIIDAGSSGSRLHLYQYELDHDIPVIQEKFSASTKPGLSAFVANPEAAGESLAKMLDGATTALKAANLDPHTIPISILATAGMRLLPEAKQVVIYQDVLKYLQKHYAFPVSRLETISGKMEGVYGWLDVNYLSNHFQDNHTLGSIDMGGASTEIAFDTADMSQPDDVVTVKIGQNTYNVFSKSFLGLGQDQALSAINKEKAANACYPRNYPLGNTPGQFDFGVCTTLYNQLLQAHQVIESIPPLGNQSFVAFSGAYYTLHFFAIDNSPGDDNLEKALHYVCSNSWEQLQQDYPNEAPPYLARYCANGVYLDNLLFHAYQLQPDHLKVVTRINNQDVDWALGAMLFEVAQDSQGALVTAGS
jgi:hypothetical protein